MIGCLRSAYRRIQCVHVANDRCMSVYEIYQVSFLRKVYCQSGSEVNYQ